MSNTSPWNKAPLQIVKTDEGTRLTIRAARDGDNPDFTFTMDELPVLYRTLRDSKMEVRTQCFGIYGKEKNPQTGRALPIFAAVQREYEVDGEKRTAGYAFEHEQLAAIEPQSYAVLTKWVNRKGGGKAPTPLFLAYALPYAKASASVDMGFKRADAPTKSVQKPDTLKRAKS